MPSCKEQLQREMVETRKELVSTVKGCTPEEFVWVPRPGMKSVHALLEEVGLMEKLHTMLLAQNKLGSWGSAVRWSGKTVDKVLKDLTTIRKETLAFLKRCSDKDFQTPRAIPQPWQQWWGKEATPEALVRWMGRHEYYHLGQIIYNRWMIGHNPYQS